MEELRSKKIIHIFNELKFSGAEMMYAQAGRFFENKGYKLVAISTAKDVGEFAPNLKKNNYSIKHFPLKCLKLNNVLQFVLYFYNFYKYLKKENASVLHIHKSKHFWFFSLCGFLAGYRVIRTVHSVFKNRKVTWLKAVLERYSARKLFGLTFQSIGQSVFENERDYYKNSTVKVNNWFDESKFYPLTDNSEKNKIRAELNIPIDCFVVVSVGGCCDMKNHHHIIKALANLPNSIDIFYLHLGRGETECKEKELTFKCGLESKVRFVGNTTSVRKYLVASDLYLMPSDFEGLGNSALEAMACGLPSILYNVVGLRDLIEDDDLGLLINPNIEGLINSIIKLYKSPTLREEMKIKAITKANKEYSLEHGVESILDLYKLSDK
ncbi:glycosyltransferase family 4 protein [Thalassotalea psychrophila]|uniref:Glycosyltransferase family 4 protein n=1 Tax=Thalassotalea psychrophila TaxID=3065647 RepID=A0ABY9TQT5_9GAMM|nr:glycosyltransferase family 4 protein [Colwelliaceae bacterium SQ149]